MSTQKKIAKSTDTKKSAKSTGSRQTQSAGNIKKTKSSAQSARTTTKKAGTSKKTTQKKNNSASAKSRNQQTERNRANQEYSVVSPEGEIVIWIMLAFCLILFIANTFELGGPFGRAVSHLFFGLFGIMANLMPFVLFLGICFIIANVRSRSLTIKVFSFILLLMTLSCFCELLSAQFDKSQSLYDYYFTGSELRAGGGLAGGILCRIFCPIVGTFGAWICNIVLFFISIITISGHSAIDNIYQTSMSAVETVRPEIAKKRELQKERRKNKALMKQAERQERINQYKAENDLLEFGEPRREKVYSGVSRDTRVTDTVTLTEDIHEIIPGNRKKNPGKVIDPYANRPGVRIMDERRNSKAKKMVDGVPEEIVNKQMQFTINGEEEPAFDSGVIQTGEMKKKAPKPAAKAEFMDEEVVEQEISKPEQQIKKNPKTPKKEQEKELENLSQEIRQNEEILEEAREVYEFPPLKYLARPGKGSSGNSKNEVRETAAKLQSTLESFGVNVTVTNVSCGPAVTRYELTPEQGVKVSRIVNLADDIKLNLAAADIRIEAPIPGKSAVGIEVPNKENSAVYLRELLESEGFDHAASNLTFAVGKDIAGKPVITDIAKMPHLLIAGATGSGKSVCINTLIMSILYKANPNDVKLIMIDPKVVELSVYNGIPHLMIPVVTDPKKASGALNWAVAEMTSRYEKFASIGVRDLKGYNQRIEGLKDVNDPEKPKKLPQIVIIVDELADLMMVAPGEVEDAICRLAQLARACGIHLIIATQRPSVNVITGLIKANMPSRIAFAVTSGVDSRTILDMNGAEKLLGKGDMLFYPQGYPKPVRVQGAFVQDEEVIKVTEFLKDHMTEASTSMEPVDIDKYASAGGSNASGSEGGSERDSYFQKAAEFIIEKDKASIGMLQRVFKIGFNRAARIMDQLAEAGVVGPEEGTKPRKILMSMEEFEQFVDEYL